MLVPMVLQKLWEAFGRIRRFVVVDSGSQTVFVVVVGCKVVAVDGGWSQGKARCFLRLKVGNLQVGGCFQVGFRVV